MAQQGTVKWYKADKGFGFITLDDEGGEALVHFSAIRGPRGQALDEGQRVKCDVANGPKGLQATNVETWEG
jgi:CspA family cold shock protein